MFFQVSGLFFRVKIGPKLVPNRIIDAEGVRKPLDRPLDGSWMHLGAFLAALEVLLERSKKGLGDPQESSGGARGEG